MRELSQAEKDLIAATVASKGWGLIEELIRANIVELKLPDSVREDKPWQDIAVETLGKGYAVRRMKAMLRFVNGCGKTQIENGNETYI